MLKLTPMRALALAVFVCGIAVRSFAVTYVVPPDRFEIERASAIVIGRVLGSHVEASRFGIETVTNISLEETIKGGLAGVVQVHEPGGTLGGETRLVPGVPWFVEGELMLLLLYQREDGTYVVSDLQLGSFRFVRDASGQELLVRTNPRSKGGTSTAILTGSRIVRRSHSSTTFAASCAVRIRLTTIWPRMFRAR